jgi:hypothetical protein
MLNPDLNSRARTQAQPKAVPNLGLESAIALASVSVLAMAIVARWGAALGEQLGSASEALFRGDRLPLLKASRAIVSDADAVLQVQERNSEQADPSRG